MALADIANRYIDEQKPWVLAKDPDQSAALHGVCTQAMNLFRVLAVALKPILPQIAAQAEAFLNAPISTWADFRAPLLSHRIAAYSPLFTRIDPKNIQTMIDASKNTTTAAPAADTKPAKAAEPKKATAAESAPGIIGIDDFAKLDLRIGKVLECGFVDGSDKLLRFLLDAGDLGQRQIFSGIRGSYAEPDKLVGRNVVFIANLAPRKMRFGVSEGMILSAGADDGLYLLDADSGAQPGHPVK
jgi:methionyl-tRNA synthetase